MQSYDTNAIVISNNHDAYHTTIILTPHEQNCHTTLDAVSMSISMGDGVMVGGFLPTQE